MLQMNDSEIQATFLHPSDPSKLFMYPSPLDILWVPASKVLTEVDPETATGHICHQLKEIILSNGVVNTAITIILSKTK
jgi:hypothetical protein